MAKMSFLRIVARCIGRLSHSGGALNRATVPWHREASAEVAQVSVSNIPWMNSQGGIPGISHRQEGPEVDPGHAGETFPLVPTQQG